LFTLPNGRALRLLDCDVHPFYGDPARLLPRMPEYFRQFGLPQCGNPWTSPISLDRLDASPPHGEAGTDVAFLRLQHMDQLGVDHAILSESSLLQIGVHPHAAWAAAAASACNDWLLEEWLSQDPRFLGSILVAPQDAERAAQEIRRIGQHAQIAQVIMTSASRVPYGNKAYWPIYAAATEMDLPVALHPGGDARGIANPPAAGYPTTYLEWHTLFSTNCMAQVTSLVCEGVFQQFPTLRVVLVEGGISWVAHLAWRLDKNWRALRVQAPWLRELPSDTIRRHLRFTTQPFEEPRQAHDLWAIVAMLEMHECILFSSDYPHWDADSPAYVLSTVPQQFLELVAHENATRLFRQFRSTP
jgi:uncharacterized protein